jgi:uncharacterized membrane protein YGL010W
MFDCRLLSDSFFSVDVSQAVSIPRLVYCFFYLRLDEVFYILARAIMAISWWSALEIRVC